MPSGSKKRKAAKKKKVQQTNNNHPNSSLNSHGDDDVKHYDEKESDGGEVSSPASQDHHNNQHPFAEGEEKDVEKRVDSSSVQLLVPEKNSVEAVNHGENMLKVGTEEEGVVQIEYELKSEDSKSKDTIIESTNEIHNGGSSGSSSSSSSSSSDDESHAVEEKTVVVQTGPAVESVKPFESLLEVVTQVNDIITTGETDNGVVETGSAVDSVKLADSLSEVVNQVNNSIPGGETDNGVVETGPAVDLVKPVDYLSEVVNRVSDSILVGETDNGGVETASVVEQDKVTLTEQVVQVIESASIDNHTASCVELDLQENGEKKLPTLDDNTGLSPVLMDLGSRKKGDEVVSTSEEKAAVFLDAMDSATEVLEDKLVLSYNAPNVLTSNGAELVKDSENPVCSDSQPLVAPAPRMVQKTSLKSCCGMFELFSGSDR